MVLIFNYSVQVFLNWFSIGRASNMYMYKQNVLIKKGLSSGDICMQRKSNSIGGEPLSFITCAAINK